MAQAVPEAGGRVIRGALVVTLSLAVAGPARAAAPTTAVEPVLRANLELDTTAAGPSGPIIHSRLDELGNRQLRRAEILPGRSARDPGIKVSVRALAGEEPGYVVASALVVEGQPVEGSAHETDCRLCTEGEAVERATAEIERLVPLIRERAQAERDAAAQAKPEPPPVAPVEAPRGLGGRGKAGIGLLALGGVGLGVGAGLAALQPRPDPDAPLHVITTRPAGFALIGVGAAALISGAVLVALDRRPTRPRASLAPTVVRAGAGLARVGVF